MLAEILPRETYREMLAAADAAGLTRIRCRISWYKRTATEIGLRGLIRPNTKVAQWRCKVGPCVELWVVADADAAADWEAF